MSLGATFGIFAGWYYWFLKMTGYKYSEGLGKLHLWLSFIGVDCVFFPQHFLALNGMPRRIADYPDAYGAGISSPRRNARIMLTANTRMPSAKM
jgi:cytochrome c oxidase subunit I